MHESNSCNCRCSGGDKVLTCFGCVETSGDGTLNGVPYCYTLGTVGGSFSWNVDQENEIIHSSVIEQQIILTSDGECPGSGEVAGRSNCTQGVYWGSDGAFQNITYEWYQKNHWVMTDLSQVDGASLKIHDSFFENSGFSCCDEDYEPLPEWETCSGVDWYSEADGMNTGASAFCFWRNVSGPLKFFKQSAWTDGTLGSYDTIIEWNKWGLVKEGCCGSFTSGMTCLSRGSGSCGSNQCSTCSTSASTNGCGDCAAPEDSRKITYVYDQVLEPKIEFYGEVDFGNSYYGISKSGDFSPIADSGYDATLPCSFSWDNAPRQFQERSTDVDGVEKSLILNYNCSGCWTPSYDYDTKDGYWPEGYSHVSYSGDCQTFNPSGSIPNMNMHFLRNTLDMYIDFPDNTGFNFKQNIRVDVYSNYFNYRSSWTKTKVDLPPRTDWNYCDGTYKSIFETTTCSGCNERTRDSYEYIPRGFSANTYPIYTTPIGPSGCGDNRNSHFDEVNPNNCEYDGSQFRNVEVGLWSCQHDLSLCDRFSGFIFGNPTFKEVANIRYGTPWSGIPPSNDDADRYNAKTHRGMLLASYYKEVDCADFPSGVLTLDAVEDSGAGPFNTPQYMYSGYWNFPPQITLTPGFCLPEATGGPPNTGTEGGGPPPL